MANTTGRRARFGSVRQLPSGRYQARHKGTDGLTHTAPMTFPTKSDAWAWLATVQTDLLREVWKAPARVTDTIGEYGTRWIRERAGLKDSTRRTYLSDFTHHVEPYLGTVRLDKLTPDMVRTWRADLLAGVAAQAAMMKQVSTATRRNGESTAARGYRLLHAILATAVEDEVLTRNPCRIKNGGSYDCPERPTLRPAEIETLSQEVPAQYRVLVLVAAYSGLRMGEITELRRRDFDPDEGVLSVRRTVYHVAGERKVTTPKSRAGNRDVLLPAFLVEELKAHLRDRATIDPNALVFTTATGRQANHGAPEAISSALSRIGRPDATAHDLRHTAGTLRAQHGATIRDLMQAIGHSTPDAALRYQHASVDHQRIVADRLDELRTRTVG